MRFFLLLNLKLAKTIVNNRSYFLKYRDFCSFYTSNSQNLKIIIENNFLIYINEVYFFFLLNCKFLKISNKLLKNIFYNMSKMLFFAYPAFTLSLVYIHRYHKIYIKKNFPGRKMVD